MCVKCREADQEHPASAEELYGCDSGKHSDEALLDHVISQQCVIRLKVEALSCNVEVQVSPHKYSNWSTLKVQQQNIFELFHPLCLLSLYTTLCV